MLTKIVCKLVENYEFIKGSFVLGFWFYIVNIIFINYWLLQVWGYVVVYDKPTCALCMLYNELIIEIVWKCIAF